MAIVINTSPGTYLSAHEYLLFVVYEATKANDAVTYPDYKYVADVYVNGVMVARKKVTPDPVNKRGVFDISTIVRNYVSSVFSPTAGQLLAQQSGANEFFVSVVVKFGEEYNLSTYTDLTVDSARVYFNHYNADLIGAASLLSGYTNKCLSLRPAGTSVDRDDNFHFISYLPTSTTPFDVEIKAYSGTTNTGTITQSITPAAANTLQVFNIAPVLLNTLTAGFISDSTTHYTVEVNDDLYALKIDCEPKYETYTLHFLNRFGGFDSKDFNKVSRKSIAIEKKSFEKLPYKVDNSGVVSFFNSNKVYHETKSTYAGKLDQSITLNSDILSDAEYEWLGDLVASPLVYMQSGDYFLPVGIKATNYEFKKVINDKLTNLTIEIDLGKSYHTQYR